MANELDENLSALACYGEITFLEDTGHTLADKVIRKIQDGSYTWVDVVDEFNSCLEYLSGKYNLLELEHTEDITTGTLNHVPLPTSFQKNLWHCRSITHNRPIGIDDTIINLFRRYSVLDLTGNVRHVAVKGRHLYYQRIPSTAETLRLIFYRYPERLRTRQDKPTCLPPHLVEPLLVNYACKEIFSEIEDGIEGTQVNTQRYTERFNKAEAELLMFVGPDRIAPIDFPEEIAWDAYV